MIRILTTTLITIGLCLGIAADAVGQAALLAGNGPTMTIIDAGAEPRRVLRYRFNEDSSESASMELGIDMGMSMGGIQIPQMGIPTIRMVIGLSQVDVSEDGSARYEFNIGETELIDSPGTDPAIANAVRASLGQLPSMSGWARVDSRGAQLEGGINLGGGIDPQLSQLFDSAEQGLQQMSAPLPEQAVGAGAVWEVVQQIQSGGFAVNQTASYTIEAIQGDLVTLAVSMSQSAPPQQVEVPGMPAGAGANLESLEASGTGMMQINLGRFMPTSALDMNMAITLGISAQGANQQISMNMNSSMQITPIE